MELNRRNLAVGLAGGIALAAGVAKARESNDTLIVVNRKQFVRVGQIAWVELVEFGRREDQDYNCWLNIFLKGYEDKNKENANNKAPSDYLLQTELRYALTGRHFPDPDYPIDPIELKGRIERLIAGNA